MFKLSQLLVKCTKNSTRLPGITRLNLSSSPVAAELKSQSGSEEKQKTATTSSNPRTQRNIVAAAFASLNAENIENVANGIRTPYTDDKIANATNINELLSISDGNGISRKHALKVVSVLADWTSNGKVTLPEFESDPRFIRLCRVLTKNTSIKNKALSSRSEDLSTILSVTADDEAAKLVSSITLPQMVKVMSTLSQKKRRSTLLLRALAYNITGSSDRLDLKQSADLLFSMSCLNFPDENLLSKISNDISTELRADIKKSAVIGSILTSIGLMKYKNIELIDALCEWVLKNHTICRPQDLFSVLITLGVLNHLPVNSDKLFEVLIPQLNQSEAGKPIAWLEIVWSLVLLNQATPDHVSSVLNNEFIEKVLEGPSVNTSARLKLLNINGSATHLMKDYKGPTLEIRSDVIETKIQRTKEKTEMVNSIIDTLKNLIQGENYLRVNVNTNLGFFIDAECLLDKKFHPLPLDNKDVKDSTRIAIIALDYHDMTRGRIEPSGINALATKLLTAKGYKVLPIPYSEFKPRDKLVNRVKYLESKLKEVVNS